MLLCLGEMEQSVCVCVCVCVCKISQCVCLPRLVMCKTVQATPQTVRHVGESSSQGAPGLNGATRGVAEGNGSVANKRRGDTNELERLFSGPSHCGERSKTHMVSRETLTHTLTHTHTQTDYV